MKILARGFILVLLFLSTALFAEQPEPLIWGIIDYPPYIHIQETYDGWRSERDLNRSEATGFVIDVISRILEELDVDYRFQIETWNTLYPKVLSGKVHTYGPFVRIPEREDIVYWPESSLVTSYTSFAVAEEGTVDSLEDLVNGTFLVVENDLLSVNTFEQFMESMQIPYTLQTVITIDEAVRRLQNPNDPAIALIIDTLVAQVHPDLFVSPMAFSPRVGYWTSSTEVEPWVINIVDQVSARIAELRDDPTSYYYEIKDQYFPIITPGREHELPTWVLFLMIALFVAVVVALGLVHILTQRIRANAAMLREAVHQKTLELTAVYEQLIQSEKMVTLGEAVAGMAHEISTPLGVAYTAITLLVTAQKSSTDRFLTVAKDTLPVVVENLRRAGNLIQTFKQITIDQTSGALRIIELPAYIQQIWDGLSQKYIARKIMFTCYVENHLGEQIRVQLATYPGALSRVLINLFDNSVEHGFTHDVHYPKIRCIIKVYHQDDDMYIQATVEDNGVGYPKDAQSKIMEPFYTTCPLDSRHSGLGLTTAYRLLEKTWDLRSWVIENRSGGGVRVRFLLRVLSEKERQVTILDT